MVENHATFAQIVCAQFLAAHEVVVVGSLAAAREAYEVGRFDAFLVDFDLDDGKGDVLVRELRRSGFCGRIVGISSHEAGNAALIAAGADASCPKAAFASIARSLE